MNSLPNANSHHASALARAFLCALQRYATRLHSLSCINQRYSFMRFTLLIGFSLILCRPTLLVGQTLQGQVYYDSTAAPVPFASVGVKGKALGTVADAQGRFSFSDSPDLAATDTVVVTCVGYQPARLVVRQLRQQPLTIRLRRQPQTLREVMVRHQQLKPQVLGRTGTSGIAHWGVNSIVADSTRRREKLGSEFGTFLTSSRNCYVDDFNVYVARNPFRQVRLRLLFYAVRNSRPAELLLPADIQLVLTEQQHGWISVDLRPYNLQLNKGQKIVVALQWLDAVGETAGYDSFDVPAAFPTPLHLVYTRNKSQDQWKFYPGQPSLYLNVQSWR
ncbi:carboxypeptidase-like regulatory domain-containing protein [Hymenobacter defluvii]|uniref:Carboxypeptidase-like regulatory domain-containing protein n=1 Tax=Hymenobacter defluvii TaxID=2054411 RepID=A0ABS3T7G8_9BACT|nr:carboxypeptidase-like regulatory domain-containing protein [Hymenobacter defluvii]MBO3269589.1 carboxypeptidase-like regulatory domain-containing protein [Hymenobacter defluvii]